MFSEDDFWPHLHYWNHYDRQILWTEDMTSHTRSLTIYLSQICLVIKYKLEQFFFQFLLNMKTTAKRHKLTQAKYIIMWGFFVRDVYSTQIFLLNNIKFEGTRIVSIHLAVVCLFNHRIVFLFKIFLIVIEIYFNFFFHIAFPAEHCWNSYHLSFISQMTDLIYK